MQYVKPSAEGAYAEDFSVIRSSIENAGFIVLSGSWASDVLTIETDQTLPYAIAHVLGLTADQGT